MNNIKYAISILNNGEGFEVIAFYAGMNGNAIQIVSARRSEHDTIDPVLFDTEEDAVATMHTLSGIFDMRIETMMPYEEAVCPFQEIQWEYVSTSENFNAAHVGCVEQSRFCDVNKFLRQIRVPGLGVFRNTLHSYEDEQSVYYFDLVEPTSSMSNDLRTMLEVMRK